MALDSSHFDDFGDKICSYGWRLKLRISLFGVLIENGAFAGI